jgi:hypothetical protein
MKTTVLATALLTLGSVQVVSAEPIFLICNSLTGGIYHLEINEDGVLSNGSSSGLYSGYNVVIKEHQITWDTVEVTKDGTRMKMSLHRYTGELVSAIPPYLFKAADCKKDEEKQRKF